MRVQKSWWELREIGNYWWTACQRNNRSQTQAGRSTSSWSENGSCEKMLKTEVLLPKQAEGCDGQFWLESKESCQRRWGHGLIPLREHTHTVDLLKWVGVPHTGGFFLSPRAEHLCLSSVSLHLLCVYSESAGGRQAPLPSDKEKYRSHLRIGNGKIVYCGFVFIFHPLGSCRRSSGRLTSKTLLTLKKDPCVGWRAEERGRGGSGHDNKGRERGMKTVHVFKSSLEDKRTEMLLQKPQLV